MIRVSADLGQQNIPQPLVVQIIPAQTLYWRVQAGSKTIEVWNDASGKFYVIEGDFKDGVWGEQDLKIAYEPRDLSDAKGYVKANYSLTVDDNTEVPVEAKFKRLMKKVQGS